MASVRLRSQHKEPEMSLENRKQEPKQQAILAKIEALLGGAQ